jgi:hypothetical protein
MALQFGTHIDALCHAWHDDKLYNGFPSHGTRSTTRAVRCGVEKMGPIVARGILLNVLDDGKPLAKGTPVTRATLSGRAAGRRHRSSAATSC